jgi:hypothetical protein
MQFISCCYFFVNFRWLAPLLLLLDLYEKVSVISKRKAEAEKTLVRQICKTKCMV